MNSLDQLLELRDRQREEKGNGKVIVIGRDTPWENTRQGKQKWYMHPNRDDLSLNSYMFWVEEIEPGGHSGLMQFQGGRVGYVWRGQGYTEINGRRHEFTEGDVLNIPIFTPGVRIQFFNTSEDSPLRMVFIEPNFAQVLGVDRGCGLEQLSSASSFADE